MKYKAFFLIISLFFTTFPLACQVDELLVFEIWCDLEPLLWEEDQLFTPATDMVWEQDTIYPLTKEQAANRILEQARYIASAMLYGYTFSYTPSDKARSVKEEFILNPIAEVQRGDPRLKIRHSELRDNLLFALVGYAMDDFQVKRMQAWQSKMIPNATGKGDESFFPGHMQKIESLKTAIKQAIRNHFRELIFNKPRCITGKVIVFKQPQTTIVDGNYSTLVEVKFANIEIIPYTVY
jgi:hypothetical protein